MVASTGKILSYCVSILHTYLLCRFPLSCLLPVMHSLQFTESLMGSVVLQIIVNDLSKVQSKFSVLLVACQKGFRKMCCEYSTYITALRSIQC